MAVLNDYEIDIQQFINGMWVLIGTMKFPTSTEESMENTVYKIGEMMEQLPILHLREGLDSFIITVANGPIRLMTFDKWRRKEQTPDNGYIRRF